MDTAVIQFYGKVGEVNEWKSILFLQAVMNALNTIIKVLTRVYIVKNVAF